MNRTKSVADLRSAVAGPVYLPGDGGFDAAARPWNTAVAQTAAAVVDIADAADAVAVVNYARDRGLGVTTQPNGHGASGNLRDDVILVRTSKLNQITVDPTTATAQVGAGASWGDLLTAAQPHQLVGLAGSSGAVSVAGYTLGGGLSWFGRARGWASDAVTAFGVVDAKGNSTRITLNSDPDLFWALRGGGGDFALVTSLEFGLFPAPAIYGGRMLWPADRAPQVLDAFREVTTHAPDELTVWFQRLQFPSAPPMVGIDTTYLGDLTQGHDLLQGFDRIDGRLADTRKALAPADIGGITGEPTNPTAGTSRTEILTHLDDTAATALLEPIDPLFNLQVRHLGGAFTRHSDSAAGTLTDPYCVIFSAAAPTRPAAVASNDRIQSFRRALAPYLGTRIPFTFLTPGDTAVRAFTPDTLSRLRQVKSSRDPRNVFTSNFPINT
ncbi:FAD-dependent oxidoreductase [Nocardia sp. NBC_00511]|uniref:FAD-binding oxidoreductase n=1 Tax=Nocardia sp. NBC_00511 TaxID=2903591 RepID=UPI002F9158F3